MSELVPIKLMRQKDVAEMLSVSESWVEQKRLSGGGPTFMKIGRNVRYLIDDVIDWINAQRRYSTSQLVYTDKYN